MFVFLRDYFKESSRNMQARLTANMETLAKRLKAARQNRGLRQEALAELSGLKQSDISKIENGLILKTTGIVALAKALRCDPGWLADGQGEAYPVNAWPFKTLTLEMLETLTHEQRDIVEKVALLAISGMATPSDPQSLPIDTRRRSPTTVQWENDQSKVERHDAERIRDKAALAQRGSGGAA